MICKKIRVMLMNIVLLVDMVPEVFYIHKHCLTKIHSCCVVVSFIMGLCSSLLSNLADLDEWGWQRSRVTGVIFQSFFSSFSFLPTWLLHSFIHPFILSQNTHYYMYSSSIVLFVAHRLREDNRARMCLTPLSCILSKINFQIHSLCRPDIWLL